MSWLNKILPGTGRGTMWNMVEGPLPTVAIRRVEADPSVTPSARHLPVPGRI